MFVAKHVAFIFMGDEYGFEGDGVGAGLDVFGGYFDFKVIELGAVGVGEGEGCCAMAVDIDSHGRVFTQAGAVGEVEREGGFIAVSGAPIWGCFKVEVDGLDFESASGLGVESEGRELVDEFRGSGVGEWGEGGGDGGVLGIGVFEGEE